MSRNSTYKVVQVGKYYSPFSGGIENNTRQLAEALLPHYKSYVVCMRPSRGSGGWRTVDGVDVYETGSAGQIWRQQIIYPIAKILGSIQPDCIHFHSPNPLMAYHVMSYMRSVKNVKLVVTHHADLERPEIIRRITNRAYYQLLDRADWLITYTDHAFSASRELAGREHKHFVLPHGVSIPHSLEGKPKNASASSLLVVGFLGRLENWKGVQVLIKSISRFDGAVLKIAGDGGYRKDLEQLVIDLGITDRVSFLGSVSGADKRDFLDSLDILALPSLHNGETFGQSLVEAQLAGAAVIASDLPTGIQSIVINGETGLLFPPGDENALYEKLCMLADDQYRKRIAEQGLNHAKGKFSFDIIRNSIVRFYQENVFNNRFNS